MKTEHQLRINEFMYLAGQSLPDLPCIPSEEVRVLRAKLIFEEALETIEALGFRVQVYGNEVTMRWSTFDTHDSHHIPITPNLVEIADGCADLSVVSIGTLSACGIADAPLLAEVDESNLRKFGEGSYRREDGKWMKPPGWTGPDVRKILNQQQWKDHQ